MLSAHPFEYRPLKPNRRNRGDYLRTQAHNGFLVREPSESWIPYLMGCDIVVTDHTSVALHSPLLERLVVSVPVPDEVIREDAADLGEVAREDVKEQPADDPQSAAARGSRNRSTAELMRSSRNRPRRLAKSAS